MSGRVWKTIVLAAVASSSLFAAANARASDRDHWDRERWGRERWEHRHDHRHDHGHGHGRNDDRPRQVIVERQPIIVQQAPIRQQPVMMAPVYVEPVGRNYGPPADPSVNFNFSFPR